MFDHAHTMSSQGALLFAGAAGGYMVALWSMSTILGRSMQKRATQLIDATVALDHFYDGLELMLPDRDLPASIRDDLLWLEKAISNRELSTQVVNQLCRQMASDGEYAAPLPMDDADVYAKLRNEHPVLSEVMTETLMAGITAMILSWRGTAQRFEAVASRITSPRRQVFAATRSVRDRSFPTGGFSPAT